MRTALALAVVLVLSGCSAPVGVGPDPAESDTANPDDGPAAETSTDRPTPDPTASGADTDAPGDDTDEGDEALVSVEGPDPDANETDLFLHTRRLLDSDAEPPAVVVTRTPSVDFPDREIRTFRALFVPALDPDAPPRRGSGGWPTGSPAFYYQRSHTVYVNPLYVDNPAVDIEEILIEEFAHAVQFRNETFSRYYDEYVDGVRFRSDLTTDERLTVTAVREGVGDVFVTSRVQRASLGVDAEGTLGRLLTTQYAQGTVAYRIGYGPYLFGYEYADRRLDRAVETFSVYADPPTTGEQVLHDTDEPPTALSVAVEGDLDRVRTDTYGELFLRPALSSGLDREAAARAADGWGSDRLLNLTYDAGGGRDSGFVWVLDWDDGAEAEEFTRLFGQYLADRGRATADGRYELEGREWDLRVLDDDTVAVVIGPASFHEAVAVDAGGDSTVTVSA